MTKRILVRTSYFSEPTIERRVFEGDDVDVHASRAETPGELAEDVETANAIAVLNSTDPTPASFFERTTELRVLASYSVGVNHIDVDAATDHDVGILNVPGYCADEVSTHAVALLLACVRKIPLLDDHVTEGGWDWSTLKPTHRLRGATLGLVGFGDIARRVAQKAAGFGLEVVATDPYVSAEAMNEAGVEKVSFEELVDRSRYVSVHAPLTDETHHLFDRSAFERLSEGAVLVNTSRGALVDEEALYDALTEG